MLTLQIEELISFGALSCVWLADRMYVRACVLNRTNKY